MTALINLLAVVVVAVAVVSAQDPDSALQRHQKRQMESLDRYRRYMKMKSEKEEADRRRAPQKYAPSEPGSPLKSKQYKAPQQNMRQVSIGFTNQQRVPFAPMQPIGFPPPMQPMQHQPLFGRTIMHQSTVMQQPPQQHTAVIASGSHQPLQPGLPMPASLFPGMRMPTPALAHGARQSRPGMRMPMHGMGALPTQMAAPVTGAPPAAAGAVQPHGKQPLMLSPTACKQMKYWAGIYRVRDVKSWVRQNCWFAKFFLPRATCEEVNTLVDSCFMPRTDMQPLQ